MHAVQEHGHGLGGSITICQLNSRQHPSHTDSSNDTQVTPTAPMMNCDICLEDKPVTAEAYCTVCKQYLCQPCKTVHQRVKVTKSHQLLIGDDLSKSIDSYHRDLESSSAMVEKSKCPEHRGADVEYYCASHDAPCCEKCTRIEHRKCAIESISDVAKKQEIDLSNKTTLKNAKDILDEIKASVQENERDLEVLTEEKTSIVDAIKLERETIDNVVDKWEHDLLEAVDKPFDEKCKQIHDHNSAFSDMVITTEDKVMKLDRAINSCDEEAVVVASAVRKDITKYENTRSVIQGERFKVQMRVETNDHSSRLSEYLRRTEHLIVTKCYNGQTPKIVFPSIVLSGNRAYRDRVAVDDGEFYVKSPSDETVPSINALEVLQDGRTIACDYSNGKLKVYDSNFRFLCEKKMSSQPNRMSLTSVFGEVVVTLPDEDSLQLASVNSAGEIIIGRKIKLDVKGSFFVNQLGDNFIINEPTSSGTLRYHIVDRNGQRVRSISVKNVPESFWKGQYYTVTTMNVAQTTLYVVRDVGGCLGFSVNTENVEFYFKDSRAECFLAYTGATTDPDGNVYIGGSETGNIVQVDKNGEKIKVLVTGMKQLGLVKFDSSRNIMFVKQKGICTVQIYRLL